MKNLSTSLSEKEIDRKSAETNFVLVVLARNISIAALMQQYINTP
jgi:hypothetical protein